MEASGVIFEVLNQISYKLNFTYNVREPGDGSYEGMIQKVGSCLAFIVTTDILKNYGKILFLILIKSTSSSLVNPQLILVAKLFSCSRYLLTRHL